MEKFRDTINSRKFAGMLWGFFILAALYDISLLTNGIDSLYTTLSAGLIGLYGLYCGANVTQDVLNKRKANETPEPTKCPTCGKTLETIEEDILNDA